MLINPAPLAQTVSQLREGDRDLATYVDAMCDRVDAVDPDIQALLPEPGRRERLRAEAAALERRYPQPTGRPPLYGVLVAVKDIFHVDGFVTLAGSNLPPELFAGAEASCVTTMRKAGALILGKSVTTEFAYFEPGPTRNPHALDHTPGGSSSGSAAAVAAGLCQLAVGTQTIGSVIRPAAFCGVVGFKPSLDRIASQGVVYFSRSIDQVGLFTQDIAGMQVAASVLCRDWRTPPASDGVPVLGVPEGAYLQRAEPEALATFRRQVEQIEAAGVTVRHVKALDDIEDLRRRHLNLIFAEFAQEHAGMYAQHATLYRPRTADIIEKGKRVSKEEWSEGRNSTVKLRHDLEALMTESGIDLWMCPAAPGPAPEGIQATGDPVMNLPWTHAGMSAITLPAGQAATELPLGLQLVARFGADEQLVAWAADLQPLLNAG